MEKTLMLCYNRHTMSQELADELGYTGDSIFPKSVNPFNITLMQTCLEVALENVTKLNLIVTGMSTAFQMVIDYCHTHDIQLVCLHYDIKTQRYRALPMS